MTFEQVRNVGLASDAARANLLVNGGFRISQRGTSFSNVTSGYTLDRWSATCLGSSVFTTISQTGSVIPVYGYEYALTAALTYNAGDALIQQQIKLSDGNHYSLRGRPISLSIYLWTNVASQMRAFLVSDGTGSAYTYSSFFPISTWNKVTVSYTVPTDATYINAGVYFGSGGNPTFYMAEAMLVPGTVAADYVPLHPADDLARCMRYYEFLTGAGYEPVATGQSTAATQCDCTVRYAVTKAVAPTVTVSAVADFMVWNASGTGTTCTGVSGLYVLSRAMLLRALTSGLVAGNACTLWSQTGTARLVLEANP